MKQALPISMTCQRCTKPDVTTSPRQIYTSDYRGPCADSFCFASCDSPSCRPISAAVCDSCAKTLAEPRKEKA